MEGAGVGDIGVHAFFKAQLGGATQVVALPVPGPIGAFAPIFFDIGAVDHQLVGGAFVKPGKIPAQHEEVRAHGQGQGHVVVVDNAAIGANGHVDTGLLKVFIPGGSHFDEGGGLSPANALGLPGDADGTAADADFHKVCPRLGQEQEALPVHHIAGAHLHGVAVLAADPVDGLLLPAGKAFGGVDAQNVGSGLYQGGHPLGVVPGVDAGANQVPFVTVQKFQRVVLMRGIVLPEDEVQKVALLVYNG